MLDNKLISYADDSIVCKMICHTIYVYLFWCKLNSLTLVDLFIQKVIIRVGRSLQNTLQIYIVEVIYLQVINASDYTHRTAQVINMFGSCMVINLAKLCCLARNR